MVLQALGNEYVQEATHHDRPRPKRVQLHAEDDDDVDHDGSAGMTPCCFFLEQNICYDFVWLTTHGRVNFWGKVLIEAIGDDDVFVIVVVYLSFLIGAADVDRIAALASGIASNVLQVTSCCEFHVV